ncbi:MAG: type II toxin-antitoxin system HicB family antitoxin [Chloroflexi bacterium]|nr:type II toxin-antitoxin system HicB family antitoxin [Chloroflexota bacterium]
MEEYTVIIYPAEERGYWAKVPSMPGCYSQGETIDETQANVREAIESHIMALREQGEEIPREELRPIITSSKVEVAVWSEEWRRPMAKRIPTQLTNWSQVRILPRPGAGLVPGSDGQRK